MILVLSGCSRSPSLRASLSKSDSIVVMSVMEDDQSKMSSANRRFVSGVDVGSPS